MVTNHLKNPVYFKKNTPVLKTLELQHNYYAPLAQPAYKQKNNYTVQNKKEIQKYAITLFLFTEKVVIRTYNVN